METNLRNQRDSFTTYITKVDKIYIEKVKPFNDLFNNEDCKKSELFMKGLFLVIKSFLEGNAEELFIKIPVQEFGIKENAQNENYTRVQGVVHDVLSLFVSSRQMNLISSPDLIKENIGCLCYKKCEQRKIYEIATSNRTESGVRPKIKYPEGIAVTTTNLVNQYEQSRKKIFKLKSCPDRPNEQTFNHIDWGLEQLLLINKLSKENEVKQYNSALIVGFNDDAKRYCRFYSNIYFYSPLRFATSYDDVADSYDIVVFIGDNKYKNQVGDINKEIGFERTKKAIYIGTELENYSPNDKRKVFEFSSREMYHYFARDKFPEFKTLIMDFPWLNNYISSLNKIMDPINNLEENAKRRIISLAARHCISIDIENPTEDNVEFLSEYLYNNAYLTEEQEDSILDFYKNTTFADGEITPKYAKYNNLVKKYGESKVYIVNPFTFRFKRKGVKNFINNQNITNKHYILDIQKDDVFYIDMIKYLMKHQALGTFHLFSYFSLKKVSDYILSGPRICNSAYRVALLNGLIWDNSDNETVVSDRGLDNYFSSELLQDYIAGNKNFDASSIRYLVDFSDGETAEITGNVIYNSEEISIDELYDDYIDELPIDITYYSNPTNFDSIVAILSGLPKGKTISNYAQLWKNLLRERCITLYDGNYRDMLKNDFPFLPPHQNYINGKNHTYFPRKIRKFIGKLKALNLLNPEDERHLAMAHKASSKSSGYGRCLKDDLFHYLINDKEKSDFILSLEKKGKSYGEDITINSLLADCISTKTVKSINLIKNK